MSSTDANLNVILWCHQLTILWCHWPTLRRRYYLMVLPLSAVGTDVIICHHLSMQHVPLMYQTAFDCLLHRLTSPSDVIIWRQDQTLSSDVKTRRYLSTSPPDVIIWRHRLILLRLLFHLFYLFAPSASSTSSVCVFCFIYFRLLLHLFPSSTSSISVFYILYLRLLAISATFVISAEFQAMDSGTNNNCKEPCGRIAPLEIFLF